jgi:perosamine synthetase
VTTMLTVYPPLETGALRPRHGRPSFPFDQAGLVLTHLGRGAVWRAFHALGLAAGGRVAMPAYHCGSEVEAARLAGLDVAFYRVSSDLVVDEDDLARVARTCDVIYLISCFGFPTSPSPPGALVIEDVAHGLFSADGERSLGAGVDAAVFCPRKSLGTPDGGALLTTWPPGEADDASAGRRPPWRRVARSMASLVAGRAAISGVGPVQRAAMATMRRASKGDAAARRGELTETVIGEWDLEVGDMKTAARVPSRVTAWAAPRVDGNAIRERRRANYEALIADLAPLCPPPFRRLPPGVCPLYVPVLSADRAAAIGALLDHGVRALEVWPVPHPLLDRSQFPELERARTQLLALPVHHLLTDEHTAQLRRAALEVLKP